MRCVKSIAFCLLLIVLVFALVPTAPASAARESFTVFIAGVPLDEGATRRMTEIVIEQHASDAAVCTITFVGNRRRPPAFSDDETNLIGEDLRVTVGGGQTGAPLFRGEITSIETSVTDGGRETLQIVGFDRLHRLTRGRNTRTWSDSSDAAIAEAIAERNGLTSTVFDKLPSSAYVLQRNESDLVFLQRRAARLGFDIWCEDTNMFFGPPRDLADPADLKLSVGFRSVRLSSAALVQTVIVRGWDAVGKRGIEGQASRNDGSGTVEFDHADQLTESERISDGLFFSQGEIDAVATAALRTARGDSIVGELETNGDAALRPRMLVELGGLGDRFDGKYLIVGATHRYSTRGRGIYTTEFSVRRALD